MTASSIIPITNHLIDCLSEQQRYWFQTHSTPVDLVFGQVLNVVDKPPKYVYFPISGFISLLTIILDEPPLEMGVIGNEGMLGATMALRNNNAPLQAIVQGTGSALRINAVMFRQYLKSCLPLQKLLFRYLYVLIQQLAQTGACNSFHEVQQRLARWLLMTQDRAHSDHLQLTHQFLASMLGVRRSAVTIAAGIMQVP
ncbi:Crp/Fnr family transcriptional regulator [Aliiglaciecola sp. SL4]|uniref:Crp/Fnr family transcriptional regulator n=1 Tax=Aliiglaciecola sp. SL4 TaxID=3239806 RepID=UPI00355C7869